MKFSILAVGKLKDSGLRALCDDYKRRVSHYAAIEEHELKDDKALLKALPKDAQIICLEVWGSALSSQQLSDKVVQWGSQANGHVCFVIGGAEGIPAKVRDAARFNLSLSSLTLPHRLARLILLEQLYRAMSIWRGEPYARED
ncbi:MAG TPA: 23S rRNA (pseudouridine(1915)-N(3))-methyltransferase RlmH [Polyangiaceae bacterium]|nr:23S rRNA (pseudouridine(1915)-N(3))-methyltransferase RlmH [Polyangiaceae bacterium]